MIRIILLRHGETTWNIEGRYQGQEDTPLSPRGIEQGKAAALALKDIHIDRAISSPLSRSHDTCRFAADYHHLWHTHPERVQMPEGENLEDVRKRAREAFDEYARNYDGETVLICAHDAVNKAILCDLLGLPMSHFWQIKQDNACINVIECDHGIWRLVTLNATTHLGYLVSGIEQKGL